MPPLSVLHCLFCSLGVQFLVLACPILTARNPRQAQFRLASNVSCVWLQSIQWPACVQFPRTQRSEARPFSDKMRVQFCVQFSNQKRNLFMPKMARPIFVFLTPRPFFFVRPIFERARVQFFMLEKLTKMKNWTHCRKIGLRPIFLRSHSVSVLTRPIGPKMGSDLGSENAKLDTQIRVGLGASNFVFCVQFWRVQFLGWPCPLSGLGAPILTRSSFCRFQFGGESNLGPAQSLAYPILTESRIDCVSNF